MKISFIYKNTIWLLLATLLLSSCSKMLDEKPERSTTIISNFKDLQALLQAVEFVNNIGLSLANVGADEFYLSPSAFSNINVNYRNAYTWEANTQLDGWSQPYRLIYYANTVLHELIRIKDGTPIERQNLKGQALFFRAFAFYQLSQVYCEPYSNNTLSSPGLPLRVTPNVDEKIVRSTLSATYQQILDDVISALEMLPLRNETINMPGKLACYGFLARVYLSMNDYQNAGIWAKKYLEEAPDLVDFNDLNSMSNPSIPTNNIESCFYIYNTGNIPSSSTTIDTTLLALYHENDLRKSIFFKHNANGTANFKGSYQGRLGHTAYCGIGTDEIYLIRAECLVRAGDLNNGMKELNTLLTKRWQINTFEPLTVSNAEQALELILAERRKELIFRGARWTDLRRLNIEGANMSLKRTVNAEDYSLPPNDKRWVWLIPEEVVRLANIPQNDR